jgi:hypothetical protein
MDLDQLALETFNLKSPYQGKNPFESVEDFWSDSERDNVAQAEADSLREWLYPEGPGLIYRIDQNGSTFCLRGEPVTSIRAAFDRLNEDADRLHEVFRTEGALDEILFFETESVELAEVVRDQLFNRRFPIEEDVLCNLSDPGFSWWLRRGPLGLDLYFRSHGINRARELKGLGPMGDRSIASLRFKQLLELLSTELTYQQLKCSEKQISFQVAPVSLVLLNELGDFLEHGQTPERILDVLAQSGNQTLYYYTQELVALRLFWLEVEHELKNSQGRER